MAVTDRETHPAEGTVIGVAKTKQNGKIVYLDILYGNRVILPDGSESQIEPAVYERVLKAYLEKLPRREEKQTAEEPGPEPADFLDGREMMLEEPVQGPADSPLHEDRTSFFYRGDREEREPDGAQLAADEAEPASAEQLSGEERRRGGRLLIPGLAAAVVLLLWLLLNK